VLVTTPFSEPLQHELQSVSSPIQGIKGSSLWVRVSLYLTLNPNLRLKAEMVPQYLGPAACHTACITPLHNQDIKGTESGDQSPYGVLAARAARIYSSISYVHGLAVIKGNECLLPSFSIGRYGLCRLMITDKGSFNNSKSEIKWNESLVHGWLLVSSCLAT
jgi:hypothetical protein